jgi:hypothetical protein
MCSGPAVTASEYGPDRRAFDVVANALARCRRDAVTGALHVIGAPGGVFHLADGSITGVDSPGAPGAEILLLRSGRISEVEWIAALRAGARTRSARAELVARGSVGSTELQVSAIMAAQDGAFAIVAGQVRDHLVERDSVDVLLPIQRGVDPDWLLREISRRLDALAALPCAVSPYRDRVAPVRDMELSDRVLTIGRRQILSCANGRRSARDIAFMAGRSLYPVTVEISRMLSEGMVEVVPVEAVPVLPAGPGRAGFKPLITQGDPLPRRQPGESGIAEALNGPRGPIWPGLPRPLHRIRAALPKALTSDPPDTAADPKGQPGES